VSKIQYKSVDAMIVAVDSIVADFKLPADDPVTLCRGFITFNRGVEDHEVNTVEHFAPMFDSMEPCRSETHGDIDAFTFALETSLSKEAKSITHPFYGTHSTNQTVFQADNPKKLKLGFVCHPSRCVHYLRLSAVAEATPEQREKFKRLTESIPEMS